MPHDAKRHRAESADPEMVQRLSARMRRAWPHVSDSTSPADLKEAIIDHEGPHDDAHLEWWYVNGHLPEIDASFFAAFFRLAVPEGAVEDGAHVTAANTPRVDCVNWAFIDRRTREYLTVGRPDAETPRVLAKMMAAKTFVSKDKHLEAALLEVFADGEVPLPDTLMTKPAQAKVVGGHVTLDFDGDIFERRADGHYHLHLSGTAMSAPSGAMVPLTLDLDLTPVKAPVLGGRNGVINVGAEHPLSDMFYYYTPRCGVSGSVKRGGKVTRITRGGGWVDREFGGPVAEDRAELATFVKAKQMGDVGWEWAAVQLDNETEVSITYLASDTNAFKAQKFAIVREGHNAAYRIDDIEFTADENTKWTSPVTGQSFPTRWTARLALPEGGDTELSLVASMPHQEFINLAAKPSFWEGHAAVTGTWRSKPCSGDAFMEVHARDSAASIETFYTMTNAVLVAPALASLAHRTDLSSFDDVVESVTPQVELIAALLSMQQQTVLSAAQKKAMAYTIAAIHLDKHHSKDGEGARTLHARWRNELKNAIPNDLRRLMLRAWMLRELHDVHCGIGGENDMAHRPGETNSAEAPYVVPAAADFDRPATPKDVAAAQSAFNGICRMDKTHSDSLHEMLRAQGVGIIVRQLNDRLVPTLTIKVTDAAFDTHIKTTVSNNDQRTRFDGFEFTWFSSGRGNLTSRACLQDGGLTLYMRTFTPEGQTVAVEHKWFRALDVGPDGKAQTFAEVYRYDPSGVEDAKSVRAKRIFRSVTPA
jgi:predicted secreted hydrolase